jgi:CheY-like chemotaxis protein
MPSGGELSLETQNVSLDEDLVEPYSVPPGKYVRISIVDTGVGMDEKTMERIFEPFFTTKEMGRGTGLGLASVYGIVKNHGGIIEVESEKGKGTIFTIYLPVCEKEVNNDAGLPVTIHKGKETVLLIDDQEIILKVGKDLLKALGYNVFVAGSGDQALVFYLQHGKSVDLVILDMVMPGMSGAETYERLKALNPHIKVLLSSGYSVEEEGSRILEKGAAGFIQKPFDISILSQKLRTILDR